MLIRNDEGMSLVVLHLRMETGEIEGIFLSAKRTVFSWKLVVLVVFLGSDLQNGTFINTRVSGLR